MQLFCLTLSGVNYIFSYFCALYVNKIVATQIFFVHETRLTEKETSLCFYGGVFLRQLRITKRVIIVSLAKTSTKNCASRDWMLNKNFLILPAPAGACISCPHVQAFQLTSQDDRTNERKGEPVI